MDYIGEFRLPGQLGQFFITLSLVASLVATFAYFKATRSSDQSQTGYWKKLARISFILESFSIIAIFSILFYIIQQHLFEYKYAWQHSSRTLELKYLLACFWEGQEGSFLLWSFWHCVLGLILIRTGRQWEAPVMTVISFAQFCLATMVAGLYIFERKLGSTPFILLRDSGVLDNAPALHVNFDVNQPLKRDYMLSIKDGNDLNPLLQNYWMVIHPPVLFLGFASTIVPFAFAIAGLWTKKFGEWVKPALPWALFATAALGIGIMMGAKWAYESLTFGGYWAWDPVENASLVPWLILIAGLHTLLIYKHTGHSLRATFLFFILSFSFILYSTFLTRSGVLGESSVHAFTDLGMNWQLMAFMFIFIAPALFFFFKRYKHIPSIKKEESTSSREFWMFIGSLVFFLSSMVIIFKTSLPVLNKLTTALYGIVPIDILKRQLAAPEDPEYAYNQIQVFVAVIIALLTAVSQYLKYKSTPSRFFWKKIAIPTLASIIIGTLIVVFGDINYDKEGVGFLGAIWLAVICSVYTIIANASYIWLGLKGNLKISGGSISHFGFGLVLLGILLSSAKKEILSHNIGGIPIDFGTESKEKTGENLTLVKGLPMKMGKFDVTYVRDSAHPKKQQWYFQIHFKSRTDNEEFTLWPNAFVNYKGNEGLMANPDSRHYLDHDVFTYISALPNPEKNKDTASFRDVPMKEGDSLFYSRGYVTLEKLVTRDNIPFEGFEPGDKATVATLKVHSFNKTTYTSEPLLIERKGNRFAQPDTIMSESIVLRVGDVVDGRANIGIKESNAVLEYVTLKAYKFPYINVLWWGIVITALGILMSMVRRIRLNLKDKD
ncbi:MAG: cytochrome c biogenesis protein CcsA [Chitinophagaceae bacterium]|nr:cytochrome c biogenesis protein CcsA [Chitinophagaceae bacterium]